MAASPEEIIAIINEEDTIVEYQVTEIATGRVIREGDEITDFRGEKAIFRKVWDGKIITKDRMRMFFPAVFGLDIEHILDVK